jgi:hypothetical protein
LYCHYDRKTFIVQDTWVNFKDILVVLVVVNFE